MGVVLSPLREGFFLSIVFRELLDFRLFSITGVLNILKEATLSCESIAFPGISSLSICFL